LRELGKKSFARAFVEKPQNWLSCRFSFIFHAKRGEQIFVFKTFWRKKHFKTNFENEQASFSFPKKSLV